MDIVGVVFKHLQQLLKSIFLKWILFFRRKLREEIKRKKIAIETSGSEIESLQQAFQSSNENVKKATAEIHNINMKVAGLKRKIQELHAIVEMETPSLQVQMEELREIENEINELTNSRKVRSNFHHYKYFQLFFVEMRISAILIYDVELYTDSEFWVSKPSRF